MDLFADDLYREIILDNYKDKTNKREMQDADIKQEGYNPSCGDDVEIFVKFDGDTICDISYSGIGCSICMSSANMLCNAIKNKPKTYAKELSEKVRKFITDNEDIDFTNDNEDIEALEGVRKLPARVKCALLSWNTLEQIIQS